VSDGGSEGGRGGGHAVSGGFWAYATCQRLDHVRASTATMSVEPCAIIASPPRNKQIGGRGHS